MAEKSGLTGSIETQLGAYLDRAARTPFAWGAHDCCLFFADWLTGLGRPDPAAPYRGYRSERAALRHVRRAGGLAALVGEAMTAAGYAATAQPRPGDIGVVEVMTGPRGPVLAGALCVRPGHWAALCAGGLAVGAFPLTAAWSADHA